MFTEDNAENCVNLFDGVLPWRWVFRHQVPLFPLVYSGKTQLFGGISGGTPEAAYAILAGQLVSGGQFYQAGITSPLLADLRGYLRNMIYLRIALKSFFQNGMMQRIPRLRQPVEMIENFWAYHYDRVIPTPAVVTGSWKVGDCTAYILINISGKTQKNALETKVDASALCFSTAAGKMRKLRTGDSWEIAPRHALLLLTGRVPEELKKHVELQFEKMLSAPRDPFIPDLTNLPPTPVSAAEKEHSGADAAKVWNGIVNRQNRSVTYISRTCVYAGKVRFTGRETSLKVKLAAPADSGVGRIEVRIGNPVDGKLIAVISLDKRFRTRSWNHFQKLEVPADKIPAGDAALFFNFLGEQLCNFGSWQFQ